MHSRDQNITPRRLIHPTLGTNYDDDDADACICYSYLDNDIIHSANCFIIVGHIKYSPSQFLTFNHFSKNLKNL